jgi:peptidyl-prolyl cis-trans isomerase C
VNAPRIACAALGALAFVSLQGCRPAGADSVPAAPLATVNGIDIRLQTPAAAPVDKAHVDFLIDTQLLQEAAIQHKLDREPLVQQAMARSNTAILAQAYLESKAAALPAPSSAAIAAYLNEHAALFAERKLFVIEQFVLDSKDFSAALKQQVDRAGSLEQVAAWLDARKVPYSRARLARHSSELEAPLLTRLQTMRKHQLFVVVAGPQTTIDALRDVRADPVPEAQALAQAEAALRESARARAEQAEIERLRGLAKINYFKQQQDSTASALGALPSTSMEK